MIVSIEGRLEQRTALSCVVVTGGFGYEIAVPLTIQLPSLGENVRLSIYAVYREDSQALYGFNTPAERDFFKLIVEKVSGIGPKIALAMLSKFRLEALMGIIANRESGMLAKIPGIGEKTAKKILFELADRLPSFGHHAPIGNEQNDAILGLIALGYKRAEAEKMVSTAAEQCPEASAEVLIKQAIRVK